MEQEGQGSRFLLNHTAISLRRMARGTGGSPMLEIRSSLIKAIGK